MSAELFAALVAAQAEMPAVEPNATNPHYKSKFVSLDHLIAKTRPILNRHGLAIVQSPAEVEGKPALRTTVLHTSGASVESVMPLILAKQDMQGLGAAITYARRYAWASALGIASEEDDDGESAAGKERGYMKDAPAERPGGELDPAWNWRDWTYRMDRIGIPPDDSREWLRQACAAIGVESLEQAEPDVRKGIFERANGVLAALSSGTDWAFADEPRAGIASAFAQAFGGAAVDGPTWRIHPSETDRPPQFAAPSAEELAEGESIPFGES